MYGFVSTYLLGFFESLYNFRSVSGSSLVRAYIFGFGSDPVGPFTTLESDSLSKEMEAVGRITYVLDAVKIENERIKSFIVCGE